MKKKHARANDYESLALNWFGNSSIAEQLESVIREIAKYAKESGDFGSPAQRKAKLNSAGAATKKLKKHLAELDPTTRHMLFGGDSTGIHPEGTSNTLLSIGAALNADALSKLVTFEKLLGILDKNAEALSAGIAPQRAGTAKVPDAVTFGVECLATFWRKYRDEAPTSGQNSDSFGFLVELVLCAPPISASATNVRSALRYYFQKRDS